MIVEILHRKLKNKKHADHYNGKKCELRVMMFSATFNDISVLLIEEIAVHRENHQPVASHKQN
jgi:hypothetical protein